MHLTIAQGCKERQLACPGEFIVPTCLRYHCQFAEDCLRKEIGGMGEHEESTAKKILHKLKPGHHDKDTDGKKEQDHIHTHASHPAMES